MEWLVLNVYFLLPLIRNTFLFEDTKDTNLIFTSPPSWLHACTSLSLSFYICLSICHPVSLYLSLLILPSPSRRPSIYSSLTHSFSLLFSSSPFSSLPSSSPSLTPLSPSFPHSPFPFPSLQKQFLGAISSPRMSCVVERARVGSRSRSLWHGRPQWWSR